MKYRILTLVFFGTLIFLGTNKEVIVKRISEDNFSLIFTIIAVLDIIFWGCSFSETKEQVENID